MTTSSEPPPARIAAQQLQIEGYAQTISLRLYRPARSVRALPIVLYFHGGGFTSAGQAASEAAAMYLAEHADVLVVAVRYSLAPRFPFPAALEDGYLAAQWAIANARAYGATPALLGVAGDDAGGNIATGLAMLARDRGDFAFRAQALIAPLLDPSMTCVDDGRNADSDIDPRACAQCYRAYLPTIGQRLHPYAAPIESRRLGGMPATLIASGEHDVLHLEAERYATALIVAGVSTEITRYAAISHYALAAHGEALSDIARFFGARLNPGMSATAAKAKPRSAAPPAGLLASGLRSVTPASS